MSYNGSGTFNLYTPGNPTVTGTTISSSWANNTLSDIATGLSTAICKDGQTTITANIPMSGYKLTGLGAGTAAGNSVRYEQLTSAGQDSGMTVLSSVAGTNTITGTLTPTLTAYAAGQRFVFTPANTNTAATTLNINSVGAKSIFWNGAACVGGEVRQNIPVLLEYDGTQFHIIGNGFNAPFLDTHPVVEGSADSTKKVRIEVDGLTTATTRVWTAADLDIALGKQPTRTVLTSGTGATYTTPTGATRINVRMVGGGGSGAQATAGNGNNGTASTFGSLSAGGGQGGQTNGGAASAGGTSSGGDINITGGTGDSGSNSGVTNPAGGRGGNSAFGGGAGTGQSNSTGNAASANTGGGGSGNGNTAGGQAGGGGAGGGYCEKLITAPSATYTYTVGAGGAGVASSGAGGSGIIIVDEFYN